MPNSARDRSEITLSCPFFGAGQQA
jgi:hypothetical protein